MPKGIDPSVHDFASELAHNTLTPVPTDAEITSLAEALQTAWEDWTDEVENDRADKVAADGEGE
jgi:hypothetical protein